MIYSVYMSAGATERVLLDDVSLTEAVSFCEEHNWAWDDGGLFWDLHIEKREIQE